MNEEQKLELMYRKPGFDEHQNITEVLDEIIHTMRDLDQRLKIIEDQQ